MKYVKKAAWVLAIVVATVVATIGVQFYLLITDMQSASHTYPGPSVRQWTI